MLRRLLAAALLTTALVPVPSLAATPTPSLRDTTRWLEENLPTFFDAYDVISHVTQSATYNFQGCLLSMRVLTQVRAAPEVQGGSGEVVYSLQMEPLSADTFATDEAGPNNAALGAPQSITEKAHFYLSQVRLASVVVKRFVIGSDDAGFSILQGLNIAPKLIAFTTTDSTLATRLLKAMRHAAQLCGARDDPF